MSTGTGFRDFGWTGLEEVKRNWGSFMTLGVVLMVLGVVAICFSVIATLASVVAFGWLLVISGVAQAIHALWRERKWSGFFLDLFVGVLSFVVGFMLVANPLAGAKTLTLLIAMFLFIGGVERIIVALRSHFHHRGWLFLNGVIDIVLGIMIWREWPYSGLWAIGLFVGIDMLFNGWSLLMGGIAARALPEHAS
jgi:uncharacterized membrane protein HdeD (DUF308 family)